MVIIPLQREQFWSEISLLTTREECYSIIGRYMKYFGCAVILLTLLASFACGQGEPQIQTTPDPAPAVQPSPEAMEASAASAQTDATAMDHQGVSRLVMVRERGTLVCATNNNVAGFGFLDAGGNTVGFDVDLCRAVAAAVLGDANVVEFRTVEAAERGPAMQSGEIDVMSNLTTWTSSRDAAWGNFVQTMFYDGQGFMAPRSLGVSTMMELRGAKICVLQGTTSELNIQDFDTEHSMDFEIVTFADDIGTNEAYRSGQCDALTTDRSGLVSTRSSFDNPDDHIILPGVISEEPLGPLVPHGDDQWFDIVKTVIAILIYAEAYGVTSDSVPSAATGDTKVDRLIGMEGSFGQETLGLPDTVAQDVIRAVGNYGEIYDRHLIPLGLERAGSRNALWANAPCADCPRGGQIYAAPLR